MRANITLGILGLLLIAGVVTTSIPVEAAPLNYVGQYTDEATGLTIDIQSFSEIEGGVQVFARVWRDGKQLGFGEDGSVDIERFRFYGLSSLVDDPNGDIIRTLPNDKGGEVVFHLREDPVAALRLSLAQTAHLVGKDNGNIVAGKIGNTTSTFNPASGANSPIDGVVGRTGVAEDIATIRAATGNATNVVLGQRSLEVQAHVASSGLFQKMERTVFGFDTSAIPDTDTITAAVFSINGYSKNNDFAEAPTIVVDTNPPAASNALANGDFDIGGWSGVEQSTARITYAGWSTAGYNDFTLNATGISNISKTGNSWFGMRLSWDFDNTTPTWGGSKSGFVSFYMADFGSNQPKLVVTHAAAANGAVSMLMGMGM